MSSVTCPFFGVVFSLCISRVMICHQVWCLVCRNGHFSATSISFANWFSISHLLLCYATGYVVEFIWHCICIILSFASLIEWLLFFLGLLSVSDLRGDAICSVNFLSFCLFFLCFPSSLLPTMCRLAVHCLATLTVLHWFHRLLFWSLGSFNDGFIVFLTIHPG